jgi:Zn-dependent protease
MCAQTASTEPTDPAPPAPRRQRITPIQWVGLGALILLFLYQSGLLRFGEFEERIPFFVALVLAITFHEFSHGFVATLFGDPTPRLAGRLTLNPLKHLDPIGTILILIGPIGWGRPMPINPGAMRNPNLGWALSSLAGPVSNVLMAGLALAILGMLGRSVDRAVLPYFEAFVLLNIGLAVFNLVPLPPLDGFGFLFGLAPRPIKIALMPLQSYGPLILLAVLFLPPLRPTFEGFMATGQRLILSFLLGVV